MKQCKTERDKESSNVDRRSRNENNIFNDFNFTFIDLFYFINECGFRF
jgi:hypothetical protein